DNGILLSPGFSCDSCNSRVNFERGKRRHGFDGRFRCNSRNCRKSFSLLHKSVFSGNRLSFIQICDLIWNYTYGNTQREALKEADVGLNTTNKFYQIFAAKEREYYDSFPQLFSADDVFEIDETHIFTRKNNQGRILKGQKYWVIGIISRSTKKIRLIVTTSRSHIIINNFITKYIPVNSIIMTDGWPGYNKLNSLGYYHQVVNHRRGFINPENTYIHTNNIERLWRSLKEFLPKNLMLENLKNYVKNFEYLKNIEA
ncbi:hypothetical protein DMUE_6269, partial [Dictyocoela muelleri]